MKIEFFPLQDVFILDSGNMCFVWVGSGASPAEKKNGFGYAHVSTSSGLWRVRNIDWGSAVEFLAFWSSIMEYLSLAAAYHCLNMCEGKYNLNVHVT